MSVLAINIINLKNSKNKNFFFHTAFYDDCFVHYVVYIWILLSPKYSVENAIVWYVKIISTKDLKILFFFSS